MVSQLSNIIAAFSLALCLSVGAEVCDQVNMQGPELQAAASCGESLQDLSQLSFAQKIDLVKTDSGVRGQEALKELTVDISAVATDFDSLTEAALSDAGPRIVGRMTEVIRETPPSAQKRQMVDKMFGYLENILKNGHPSISAQDAVRLVGETLYYPYYFRVLPSYGTEEATRILEQSIASADYGVRAQAAQWLWRVVSNEPALAEHVLALCEKYYEPEEQAADVETERQLRKLRHVIEALSDRNWKLERGFEMTEEEFVSLRKLSRDGLFGLISRGGDRGQYAFNVLLKDGCTDETMDRLLEISRDTPGPSGTSIVDTVVSALLKPFKEGRASTEDAQREGRFIDLMNSDLNLPSLGERAVRAMVEIMRVHWDTGERDCQGCNSDKAFSVLLRAAVADDERTAEYAIDSLTRLARNKLSRAQDILATVEEARHKVLVQPPGEKRDYLLEKLDKTRREVDEQTRNQATPG